MKLKILLVLSAIVTPVMIAVMMVQGAPLKISGITPNGIIDLELACTPQRALQIYNAWNPGLIHQAMTNTLIDFIFILSYGTLLYSLCLTVSKWYRQTWQTIGQRLSIVMVIAAFFDVVENIQMIKTLNGRMGKELIASTYMFAAAKFFLVALGILYILISLAGKLLKPKGLTINKQDLH